MTPIPFKLLGLMVVVAASARAQSRPAPITEAKFNELARFEDRLDASESATEVLRQWCAERGLADPAVIKAERLRGEVKPASPAVREALLAGDGRPLRYRRVRLACGTHVLSEADNWYRPDALTDDMNRQLDQSDTPFGVVVRPLNFHRHTMRVDWLVVPSGRLGLKRALDASTPPHDLLRHFAVLTTVAGTPFSLVVETYTSDVLATGVAVSR